MQEQPQSTASFWSKTWITIRFIVFGVGGFVVLWIGCVLLMDSFDHLSVRDPWALVAVPLTVAGGLMMLFGSGMWKRSAYLCVFYSIPGVIAGMAVLSRYLPKWDQYVPSVVPFFLAPMPVSYLLVRGYYKRREAALPSSAPEITPKQEVH